MLPKKTTKTLIMLAIVLFAFSFVEGGDGLYCVSLKKFTKPNKVFRRVRGFEFDVTNAKIHRIPEMPSMGFAVENNKNYHGNYDAFCPGGPCGFDKKFFYDDFVVIKTRPGVKLDNVTMKFSLKMEQDTIDDKGEVIDDGKNFDQDEVTYNFTNKDLNIRRCADRLF
ncbi:MAG: hypothetical protein L7F77_04665 [Candidatus Magnetominusculus sp. LBB02]|nr:hypothetical protein [Candidatus Magnetominusculus sp. LBB02]